jgi:molybdopterin-guanine dinucleotide biosynthesis protein A
VSVDGIVLAGGRSRRFGSDKLAAPLDGGTVLAATIAAVSEVSDGVIVAGPALPYGFRAGDTPVIHVRDREPYGGPLAALADALELKVVASPLDRAIVVGGDMPGVVPAVLAAMLELLDANDSAEAVTLAAPESARAADGPEHRPIQVLPIALRHDLAARAARAALEAGQRSLRALVERLGVAELPVAAWRALDPAGATLADVDTPADLERLRSNEGGPARPH